MIRRGIVAVLIVLLSAVGTWYTLVWANSPVKQRVTTVDTTTTTQSEQDPVDVTTPYFSTKLPAGYRVETAKNPNNPTMLQVSAFTTRDSQPQVGITTATLPSDGMQGVADYQYRAKEVTIYNPMKSVLFSSDSFEFEKIGGGEFTTFLVQGTRYASITVSGEAATTESMQSLRQFIAAHWFWV